MFKRLVDEKLTREECRGILSCIPRQNREGWLKIASALVSEIGESDAAELMREHFGDEKPNETEKLIASLHGAPKCTIGTLIDMAKQYGFDAKTFRQRRLSNATGTEKRSFPSANKKKEEKKMEKVKINRKWVELAVASMCENAMKPDTVKPVDLLDELRKIKSGAYREQIAAVRAGTREKTTMPQICLGRYDGKRKDENLCARSGFLVLDYDGKENTRTDFDALRKRLAAFPFTLAVFTSPSGNGLKALVRVSDEHANDKEALEAIKPALKFIGGTIDENTAALSTFIVSDDPNAFISETPIDKIPHVPEEIDADAIAILCADFLERCFFAGKDSFLIIDGEGVGEITRGDLITDALRFYRVDRETLPAREFIAAVRARRVKKVFDGLTCHKRGFCFVGRKPCLVDDEPEWKWHDDITPPPDVHDATLANVCPHIWELLSMLFPHKETRMRFLCWLKRAEMAFYTAIKSNGKKVSPVPYLLLLGKAGSGKDLLFQTLIKPLLGDRNPGALKQFFQDRPFLGNVIGSEILLGTEIQKLSSEKREAFKANLKEILGESGFFAERKGKDGFVFRGQFFCVQLSNIEDGCAEGTPAVFGKDFEDKMCAFVLEGDPERVKDAYPSDNATENAAAIYEELPALVQWLRYDLEIPQEWRDKRFGVKGWVYPAAREVLFEASPLNELAERLLYLAKLRGQAWRAQWHTVAELAREIESVCGARYEIRQLGRNLRTLVRESPSFFAFNEDKARPKYLIKGE